MNSIQNQHSASFKNFKMDSTGFGFNIIQKIKTDSTGFGYNKPCVLHKQSP